MQLECLDDSSLADVETFQEKLYVLNVEQFQRLKSLRPMLRTCTAAAIMYHPMMVSDFGPSNMMVDHMVQSVMSAKLASTPANAEHLLGQWSDKIRKDFEDRNNFIQHATEQTLVETVNQQSMRMQEQKQALTELRSMADQLIVQFGEQHRMIASLLDTRKRKQPPAEEAEIENDSSEEQEVQQETNSPPNVLARLQYGAQAAARSSNHGNKSISIQEVIIELHADGQLLRHSDDLTRTRFASIQRENESKYKAAMRLLKNSWTDEQKARLLVPNLEKTELNDAAHEVENTCLEKMAELEGKPVGRTKPFIVGIGQRYINWENAQKPKAGQGILSFVVGLVSPSKKKRNK